MYRFKYYYKDGSTKLSDNVYNDVKNFDGEIQKLTKNKDFKTTHTEKQDLNKFLKLAINEYEKSFNDIYRIDIIDNNTLSNFTRSLKGNIILTIQYPLNPNMYSGLL